MGGMTREDAELAGDAIATVIRQLLTWWKGAPTADTPSRPALPTGSSHKMESATTSSVKQEGLSSKVIANNSQLSQLSQLSQVSSSSLIVSKPINAASTSASTVLPPVTLSTAGPSDEFKRWLEKQNYEFGKIFKEFKECNLVDHYTINNLCYFIAHLSRWKEGVRDIEVLKRDFLEVKNSARLKLHELRSQKEGYGSGNAGEAGYTYIGDHYGKKIYCRFDRSAIRKLKAGSGLSEQQLDVYEGSMEKGLTTVGGTGSDGIKNYDKETWVIKITIPMAKANEMNNCLSPKATIDKADVKSVYLTFNTLVSRH